MFGKAGIPVAAIANAVALAEAMHRGQLRKGAKGEPYIRHVIEVMSLLAETTGGGDAVLIVGALLHDILEDSNLTRDSLAQDFGEEVAALVAEVTDPEGVGEEVRRRHQVESAPGLSARARLLKIADKTSNLEEIARDPPPGWSNEDILAYINWGEDVVAGCRGLNGALEERFDQALAAALARHRR